MKKSDIPVMPEFFDRYIHLVEDIPVVHALEYHLDGMESGKDLLKKLGDQKYAPEKWTVKDILQHMIDTERIQSYRALRFARGDKNILPGFDETHYGNMANAAQRNIDDLLEEYEMVRRGSIALFRSFSPEMLLQEGTCFKVNVSVLALGFVIAGHQIHHQNVIREKYFPLLK